MVEFALVVPVLVLVIFAIIQMGIVFNNQVTLTDAVRAGARTAAVSRLQANPTAVTVARVRAAAPNLSAAQLTVGVDSTWVHGDSVTVTATYPYSVSIAGLVVKSGTLQSSTVERVE